MDGSQGSKKKPKNTFNWGTVKFRKFLIKHSYRGDGYHGNAYQEDVPTVEGALFQALTISRLIENRTSCSFARAGRTDKGVHASGNYISLYLRVLDSCLIADGDPGSDVDETKNLNYVKILNNLLPDKVRIKSVVQVQDNFDARFSCLYREYEYYFPCYGLDISLMATAAKYFVGTHNFQNFCKLDMTQIRDPTRTIIDFEVAVIDNSPLLPFAKARIRGMSFLWHQVRCMMAVLIKVGLRKEDAGVVLEMLNVESIEAKPQYTLASEAGLVLKDCEFRIASPDDNVACPYDTTLVQQLLHLHVTKALCKDGGASLGESMADEERNKACRMKPYKRLLQRNREPNMRSRLPKIHMNMEKRTK